MPLNMSEELSKNSSASYYIKELANILSKY